MSKKTPIGKVSFYTGSVVARSVDGEERQLQVGDAVYLGETIWTEELSTVAIDFVDGSRKGLASESRVVLDGKEFTVTARQAAVAEAAAAAEEEAPATVAEAEEEREQPAVVETGMPAPAGAPVTEAEAEAEAEYEAEVAADEADIVVDVDMDAEVEPETAPEAEVAAAAEDESAAAEEPVVEADEDEDVMAALRAVAEEDAATQEPAPEAAAPGQPLEQDISQIVQASLQSLGGEEQAAAAAPGGLEDVVANVMVDLQLGEQNEVPDAALLQSMVQGVLGNSLRASPDQFPTAQQIGDALVGVLASLPRREHGLPDAGAFRGAVQGVLGGALPLGENKQVRRDCIASAVDGVLRAVPQSDKGLPGPEVLERVLCAVLDAPGMRRGAPDPAPLANTAAGVGDGVRQFREHCGDQRPLTAGQIGGLALGILHGKTALQLDGTLADRFLTNALRGLVPLLGDQPLPAPAELQALVHALQGGDLDLAEDGVSPVPALVESAVSSALAALPDEESVQHGEHLTAVIGAALQGVTTHDEQGVPDPRVVGAALRGVLPAVRKGRKASMLPEPTVFRCVLDAILLAGLRRGENGLPSIPAIRGALAGILGGLEDSSAMLGAPKTFEEAVQVLLGGKLPTADDGAPEAEVVRHALAGVLGGVRAAGALDAQTARWSVQGVLRGCLTLNRDTRLPDQLSIRRALEGFGAAALETGYAGRLADGYPENAGLQTGLLGILRGGLLEDATTVPTAAVITQASRDLVAALTPEGDGPLPPERLIEGGLRALFSGGFRQHESFYDADNLRSALQAVRAGMPVDVHDSAFAGAYRSIVQGVLGAPLKDGKGAVDTAALQTFVDAICHHEKGYPGRPAPQILSNSITASLFGGVDPTAAAVGSEGIGASLNAILEGLQMNDGNEPSRVHLVASLQGLLGGQLPGAPASEARTRAVDTALSGALAVLPQSGSGTPQPSVFAGAIMGVIGRLPVGSAAVALPDVLAAHLRGICAALPEAAMDETGLPVNGLLDSCFDGVLHGPLPRSTSGAYSASTLEHVLRGALGGFFRDAGACSPTALQRIVTALLEHRIPVDASGLFGAGSIAPVVRGVHAALRSDEQDFKGDLLQAAVSGILAGGFQVNEAGVPGPEAIELAFNGMLSGMVSGPDQLPAAGELESVVRGVLAGGLRFTEAGHPPIPAVRTALQGLLAGLPGAHGTLPSPDVLQTLVRGLLAGGLARDPDALPSRNALGAVVQGLVAALPAAVRGLPDPDIVSALAAGVLGGGLDPVSDPRATSDGINRVVTGLLEGFSGRAGVLIDPQRLEALVSGTLCGGLSCVSAEPPGAGVIEKCVRGVFSVAEMSQGEEEAAIVREHLLRGVLGGGFENTGQDALPDVAYIQHVVSSALNGIVDGEGLVPEPAVLEPVVRGVFAGGLRPGASGLPEVSVIAVAAEGVLRALPDGSLEEPAILQAALQGLMGSCLPVDGNGLFGVETVRPVFEGLLRGARNAGTDPFQSDSLCALARAALGGGAPVGRDGIPNAEPIELATQAMLDVLLVTGEGPGEVSAELEPVVRGILGGGLDHGVHGVPSSAAISHALRGVLAALPRNNTGWPETAMLCSAIRGVVGGHLPLQADGTPESRGLAIGLVGVAAALPSGAERVPPAPLLSRIVRTLLGEGLPREEGGLPPVAHIAASFSGFIGGLPASAVRITGKQPVPEPQVLEQLLAGVLDQPLPAGADGLPESATVAHAMCGALRGLPVLGNDAHGAQTLRAAIRGVLRDSLPVSPLGAVSEAAISRSVSGILTALRQEQAGQASGALLEAIAQGVLGGGLDVIDGYLPHPVPEVIAECFAGLIDGCASLDSSPVLLETLVRGMLHGQLRPRDPTAKISNVIRGLIGGLRLGEGVLPEPQILEHLIQGALGGGLARLGTPDPEVFRHVVRAVLTGLPGDTRVPSPAVLQNVVRGVLGKPEPGAPPLDSVAISRALQGVLDGVRLAEERINSPEMIQRYLTGALASQPGGKLPPQAHIQTILRALLARVTSEGGAVSGADAMEQFLAALFRADVQAGVAASAPALQRAVTALFGSLGSQATGLPAPTSAAMLFGGLLRSGLAERVEEPAQLAALSKVILSGIDPHSEEQAGRAGERGKALLSAGLEAAGQGSAQNLDCAEQVLAACAGERESVFGLVLQIALSLEHVAGEDIRGASASLLQLLADEQILRQRVLAAELMRACIGGELAGAGKDELEVGARVILEIQNAAVDIPPAQMVHLIHALNGEGQAVALIPSVVQSVRDGLRDGAVRSEHFGEVVTGVLLAGHDAGRSAADGVRGSTVVLAVRALDRAGASDLEGGLRKLVPALWQHQDGLREVASDPKDAPGLVAGVLQDTGLSADSATIGDAIGGEIRRLREERERREQEERERREREEQERREREEQERKEHEERERLEREEQERKEHEERERLEREEQERKEREERERLERKEQEERERLEREEKERQEREKQEQQEREKQEQQEREKQEQQEREKQEQQEQDEREARERAEQERLEREAEEARERAEQARREREEEERREREEREEEERREREEQARLEREAEEARERSEQARREREEQERVEREEREIAEKARQATPSSSLAARLAEADAALQQAALARADAIEEDEPGSAEDETGGADEEVVAVPFDEADFREYEHRTQEEAVESGQLQIRLASLLEGNRGGINHFWGGPGHDEAVYHLDSTASTDIIHDFQVVDSEHKGDVLELHDLLVNEGLDAGDTTSADTLSHYLRFQLENGHTVIFIGHEEDRSGGGRLDTFVADHKVVLENVDLLHDEDGQRLPDAVVIEKLLTKQMVNVAN